MEFTIPVDSYRRAPVWRLAASLFGFAGLAYGAWLLGDRWVDTALLLLSGLPVLLWLLFKREPLVRGSLRVDPTGQPLWSHHLDPSIDDPAAVPVRLVRWHRGEAAVWVRIRRGDGWMGDLFVDRDRVGADAWVRLQRWLTWVERGVESEPQ